MSVNFKAGQIMHKIDLIKRPYLRARRSISFFVFLKVNPVWYSNEALATKQGKCICLILRFGSFQVHEICKLCLMVMIIDILYAYKMRISPKVLVFLTSQIPYEKANPTFKKSPKSMHFFKSFLKFEFYDGNDNYRTFTCYCNIF